MNFDEGVIEKKNVLRECTNCNRVFSPIKSKILPAVPTPEVQGPPSQYEESTKRGYYRGFFS